MEQKILEVVMSLKDEMSDKLSDIGNNSSATFEKIQYGAKVAAGVSSAVFAATTGVIFKAIGAYQEVEQITQKYEYAMENLGGATRQEIDSMNEYIDTLEKKGVVDGDDMKIASTKLIQLGLTTKGMKDLLPIVNDLAVSQYGVNVSGEQLSATAEMIAKAMNGNMRGFKEFNIELTKSQENIIKYGTEAQKTHLMMSLFSEKLVTTSEDALKTSAGQMKQLNIQLGNMWETIGQQLNPILDEVKSKFIPVIEKVLEWIQANPQLTARIITVTAAVSGLVAVLATVSIAILPIIAAIGGIPLLIGAGVVAIGAAIYVFQDKLKVMVNDLVDSIKYVVHNLVEYIKHPFTFITDAIENFKFIFNQLKPTLEWLYNAGEKIYGTLMYGSSVKQPKTQYANGGYVTATEPALVHANEYVLSTAMLNGTQAIDPSILSKLGGKTNNSSVNIGTVNINNDMSTDALINKLSMALRYQNFG